MRTPTLSLLALLAGCSCNGGSGASPTTTTAHEAPTAAPVPQWIWTDAEFPESAAFVGDDTIVVVTEGGDASAIDAATGRVRAFSAQGGRWGQHVRASRDGHAVQTGAGSWSLDDGSTQLLRDALIDAAREDGSMLVDAYVLPGSERFVAYTQTQQVLVDATGRVVLGGMRNNPFAVKSIDPTGRTFLMISSTGTEIRTASDGALRGNVEGQWFAAEYANDGAQLLLASDDVLRRVDTTTGETIAHAEGLGDMLGIAPGAEAALFVTEDRVRLVDGHTLAIVADGPKPTMMRFPPLMSPSGVLVSDGPGETIVHDLRAATHVTLSTDYARPMAIDAGARRVLVRTNDAMVLLDASTARPVWSVPLHHSLFVQTARVLTDCIVISDGAATWVIRADGTTHRWPCESGYPHAQPDGSVWISCHDGSVIDAATGDERTAAGAEVDGCVYDSFAEMMGQTRVCEDDAPSAIAGVTVEAGAIVRITHGADAISIGLYDTASEVAVAVWDERGRGTDSGGMLLVREPGAMREAALHAPASANVVQELFARMR